MSLEDFALLLAQCGLEDSKLSLDAWNSLLDFRNAEFGTFVLSYLTLASDPRFPVSLKKMALIIMNHSFNDTLHSQLGSLSFDILDAGLASSFAEFSSPDLSLVNLASEFAGRLCLCQIESAMNISIVNSVMDQFAVTSLPSERFGFASVLLFLSQSLRFSDDINLRFMQLIFEAIKSDIPSDLKSLFVRTIQILIPSMSGIIDQIVPDLLELILSLEIIPEGFLCLAVIASEFPAIGDLSFRQFTQRILAILRECQSEDMLQSVFVFLQSFLGSFENENTVIPVLPALIEQLLRLIGSGDPSLCDELDSPCMSALETLKSFADSLPDQTLSFLLPFSRRFDDPIICLSSLYLLVRGECELDEDQVSYLRFCIGSEFPRIRFFALTCYRRLLKSFPDFWDDELVTHSLHCSHGDHPQILLEFHRILALLSGRISNLPEFFPFLLETLSHPLGAVSLASYFCLTHIAETISGPVLHEFAVFILDVYQHAVDTQNGDLQSDMTGVVQKLAWTMKTAFLPFCDRAVSLLVATSQNFDKSLSVHTFPPLAVIFSTVNIDFTPLLGEYTAALYSLLVDNFGDEEVVDIAAASLFFLMERFDLRDCISGFLEAFIAIFFQSRNPKCLSALADIAVKDIDIVKNNFQELVAVVEAVPPVFDNLDEGEMKGVFSLLRVLIAVADSAVSPVLVSMAIDLIGDSIAKLRDAKAAAELLLIAAKDNAGAVLEKLPDHEWIPEFVGQSLNDVEIVQIAKLIIDCLGEENLFGEVISM
jgi:hypothetical protein